MKNRVTVIFPDNVISVDGVSLRFPFEAVDNCCVIQWSNGAGQIEFNDRAKNNNKEFGEDEYDRIVAPFVDLWETEKKRLDAEAEKQAEEASSPEHLAEAIRQERNARIAATDYLMLPDYPLTEEERAAWRGYRSALRDITDLDGFPWEGPDSAPWPEPPQ